MSASSTDVLVVGGGPAGASTALRLARAGHGVTVLERRLDPAPLTRGDALVPAAVRELVDLGLDPVSLGAHRVLGTTMWLGARATTIRWPEGDAGDTVGAVWRRPELNRALRAAADDLGATVLEGAVATNPIVERGFVRGAEVELADGTSTRIRCRFLVVADGANSRFGRGLGTHRERNWPYAVSASAYFESPRHADSWIDTVFQGSSGRIEFIRKD